MGKKRSYHWKTHRRWPGEYLWFGDFQLGGVSTNTKKKSYGSHDEGWFWWTMAIGDQEYEWEYYGLYLPAVGNADLKLPRRQDAKDQLLEYCKRNLKIKENNGPKRNS